MFCSTIKLQLQATHAQEQQVIIIIIRNSECTSAPDKKKGKDNETMTELQLGIPERTGEQRSNAEL